MPNNCTVNFALAARACPAIVRAAILLLCWAGSSAAAPPQTPPQPPPATQQAPAEDLPMYVEADSAELDDTQNISVYVGNVVVIQGETSLLADHVTVHHHPDRNPRLIIALGNPAKYSQAQPGKEPVDAYALRMEYEMDKDEITLIDEAVLVQGTDRFGSDRIVYDRARGRVKAGGSAQGSERVKITITPDR